MGQLRRLGPLLVDSALALLLTILAEVELLFGPLTGPLTSRELTANALTVPFMTIPLALRRRAPTVALLLIVAAARVEVLVGGSLRNGGTVPVLALLVAMYSLAAGVSLRRALAGGGLALAVLATTADSPGNFLYGLTLAAAAWILGRVVRDRQQRAESSEDRAQRLEKEHAARIEAATADERARIARELHDIIAHSVGVMVIQASGAQKVLDDKPHRAREALLSIEVTGRQALDELHRVLGILRKDSDGESLTPQPSLRDLERLLEQIRLGGLPVEATIGGEVRSLPPGIELAAYRIVQEALTNTLKHGGRANARLTVRYGRHDLAVEICDDGQGQSSGALNTSGHGLVGMKERVGIYGGKLTAGSLPGGGYAVKAVLPLDA